jgi:hypothetical protein
MPWLKIDDGMWSNRKWLPVSPTAKALWVWAASYSAGQLTDGVMYPRDWEVVATHLGVAEWQSLAAELQKHGFLDPGPDDALVIHDYLDYNPSREEVLAERAEGARRQAEWKASKRREQATANAVSHNVSSAVSKPVPYPSRPVPVPFVVVKQETVIADETDPVVDRLVRHGITEKTANTLAAGHDALCLAWLDHVDANPKIPNKAAYLTGNIQYGKPPPPNGTGPPGRSPPRPSGLSEVDLEIARERQQYEAQCKSEHAGPAPPA